MLGIYGLRTISFYKNLKVTLHATTTSAHIDYLIRRLDTIFVIIIVIIMVTDE